MSQVLEVIERYVVPDLPNIELPEEDGEPLETNWHRLEINLLGDVVKEQRRDRLDYFAGGNMFIYDSLDQVRNREYKGPDFFLVKNIDGSYPRQKWVVWEENGRYPNAIIELMSPSTADEDLGPKKRLYEQTFRTPEYFCYDPESHTLYGWRLGPDGYVEIEPDENDRLWSSQLEAWLGLHEGTYQKQHDIWLRLFDDAGRLLPTEAEAEHQQAKVERRRAEAERQRAEAAQRRAETDRQRAEAAEAEAAKLRAELERLRQAMNRQE